MAQVDATSSRYTDYVFGGTLANGSRTSILAQPDLTWEKSRQFDLGLDFAFFKTGCPVLSTDTINIHMTCSTMYRYLSNLVIVQH